MSEEFHKVISLHESPALDWESLSKQIPYFPRGWYELAQLPLTDRIEFTQDFWLSKLPLQTVTFARRLTDFFESIEEIGIYATQEKEKDPFDVHMIYSLKGEMGFFQGGPPATAESLDTLIKQFSHINFPPDYLAFLQIHDGFSKYTDTGLIKIREMARTYQKLQHLLAEEMLVRPDGQVINPSSLIPFYESFGLHCYQCFYKDWYPDNEMGNLYFSEHERSISNFLDQEHLEENLAFPTFEGWLLFYIEDIWHIR